MFQIRIKQYKGSIPVMEEVWKPEKDKELQTAELKTAPVRIACSQSWDEKAGSYRICAEALEDLKMPVSLALEKNVKKWDKENYVFMPAAVYDGNRMESRYIPYPPYSARRTEDGWAAVITDIPHLSKEGKDSAVQLLSGDMSTPAFGYYARENGTGFLMMAKHEENGRYTGFTVKESAEHAVFSISSPGVREKDVYFFGDLPDGSGFYPTCSYPSNDEGALLKKGDTLELEVQCYEFEAETIGRFFSYFNSVRENMEKGGDYCSIPFSKAYDTVKKKSINMNFSDEGYLMVGIGHTISSHWQAGWVGGGMNTYPFLLEDSGTAREQALSTLHFIAEKLQRENGWYVPMYAKGKCYGDAFMDTDKPVLLVRKDADLLYFMLKQAMYLRKTSEQAELLQEMEKSIACQADAFVRFFEKNGQLGQFIDMETEELLAGDTASAAIAPAGLALAYEYFQDGKYLETAERLGDIYLVEYLKKGMVNGGPGEICQAPDSESAFGLLESFVQLYETTRKEKWLAAAEEAFDLAVTWVVSYDFNFPRESTAAKMGAHTRGTVFANAQNKHSAPGICTLSGNSLLKLYRFTGNKKYLEWMGRISHALSQFVSLPERPVDTLTDKPLPSGFFNERVQMSDWEGKHTVGEFLYGSNWPETTMLLTYVEIPGIYADLDRDVVWCSDHVKVKTVKRADADGKLVLQITNPTQYDAVVTVLADHSRSEEKLGHGYFDHMRKVSIPAGEEVSVEI